VGLIVPDDGEPPADGERSFGSLGWSWRVLSWCSHQASVSLRRDPHCVGQVSVVAFRYAGAEHSCPHHQICDGEKVIELEPFQYLLCSLLRRCAPPAGKTKNPWRFATTADPRVGNGLNNAFPLSFRQLAVVTDLSGVDPVALRRHLSVVLPFRRARVERPTYIRSCKVPVRSTLAYICSAGDAIMREYHACQHLFCHCEEQLGDEVILSLTRLLRPFRARNDIKKDCLLLCSSQKDPYNYYQYDKTLLYLHHDKSTQHRALYRRNE